MAKLIVTGQKVSVTHNTRCADTPKALKGEKNETPTFNHIFDFTFYFI